MTIKKEAKVSKQNIKNKELKQLSQTHNRINYESPRNYIIAITLGILCFLLGYINLHNGQTWSGEDGGNGDFSQYLLQAFAILQGNIDEFIQANQFMRTYSYDGNGPIIYPWGYPLLLAMGIKIFGFNIIMLKCINLALFSLFVSGFYLVCIKSLSNKLSFLATLLLILNPYFLHFDNRLLSDVPFMCIGIFGAYLMHYYLSITSHHLRARDLIMGFYLGIIFIIAFLIRSNGIILPVTMACVLFLRIVLPFVKNTKLIILIRPIANTLANISLWYMLIPLAVFVLGYALINMFLPNGGAGHSSMMANVISITSILGNTFYYLNIWQYFFGNIFGAFGMVLAFPFLVFGIYISLHRHFVLIIFCAGILALNIIWPFTQGLRFVFILIPFCIYWTLLGYVAIKPPKIIANICKILFISLLLINIYSNLKHEWIPNIKSKGIFDLHTYSKDALQMYDFIKNNTKQDDVIVFFAPQILYLTTNRLALYQYDECIQAYECMLPTLQKTSYVLLRNDDDTNSWLLWQPFLQKIFQTPKLTLYHINLGYNINP